MYVHTNKEKNCKYDNNRKFKHNFSLKIYENVYEYSIQWIL